MSTVEPAGRSHPHVWLAGPFAFGLPYLYAWARPDAVAHDPLLQHKSLYLNVPFFLARAVCRRAERAVLAVPDTNPLAAVYLNRLSDFLFVLARTANAEDGVDGPLWRPGGSP